MKGHRREFRFGIASKVLIALLGALGCASVSRIDAADVAPAGIAPTDDSIAAAKRQLDALKAATNSSNAALQAGASTTLSVPTLQLPDASAPAAAAPLVPLKPEEKQSANWLVDAMMKPSAKGGTATNGRTSLEDSNSRPGSTDRLGRERDLSDRSTDKEGDAPRGSADATDRAHTKPDPVANPLNRFMSEWMTPQDYSMLRRTLDEPADKFGASSGALPTTAATAGIDGLASNLSAPTLDSFDAPRPAYAPPTPTENPYLQMITEPPPTVVQPAAPSSAPASSALLPPPQLPPTEVTKPVIPDFAKPSTDDKYFKPLKRF